MTNNDTAIREAAYFKWQAAGEPCCDGVQFWLEARDSLSSVGQQSSQEDAIDEALKESFPASDPPAVKSKAPIPQPQKRRA